MSETFNLRHATETLRLHEPKTLERVQKVCERALKEYAIEKALDDMLAGWDGQDFEVMAYRNTGTSVIKLTEEVHAPLHDRISPASLPRISPASHPHLPRISAASRQVLELPAARGRRGGARRRRAPELLSPSPSPSLTFSRLLSPSLTVSLAFSQACT